MIRQASCNSYNDGMRRDDICEDLKLKQFEFRFFFSFKLEFIDTQYCEERCNMMRISIKMTRLGHLMLCMGRLYFLYNFDYRIIIL